jgi:hypothetical protein
MKPNNQRAVARTVRALRDTGRIERVDTALIAHAFTTARNLDHAPAGSTEASSAARAHLAALTALRKLDHIEAQGNALIERITAIRDTPHPGA